MEIWNRSRRFFFRFRDDGCAFMSFFVSVLSRHPHTLIRCGTGLNNYYVHNTCMIATQFFANFLQSPKPKPLARLL